MTGTVEEAVPRGPVRELEGIRVLLTRTEDDNSELRPLFERLGAEVLSLPCIAIAAPEWPKELESRLSYLASYDWIVFTSRNAVRAVLTRVRQQESEWPAGLKTAAIGSGTCRELEKWNVPIHLVSPGASARDLATALAAAGVQGKRLLLPLGDLARVDLAAGLSELGAEVESVVAYRTRQPENFDPRLLDALAAGEVDIAVFASPSAINNLVGALGDRDGLANTHIVCIGETTAEAVRARGLPVAATAGSATPEGILAGVIKAGKAGSLGG